MGKVGLDHDGVKTNEDGQTALDQYGNPIEDLVPGFSASALKFVKKVKKTSTLSDIEDIDEEENLDDELLKEDSDVMKAQLEKIDEDVKEEE